MLKRLWIYIREMFPLQVHLPFVSLVFLGVYSLVLNYTAAEGVHWNFKLLTGWGSLCLTSLAMRIADEFKDEETDKRLFPNRPYPRGSVLKSDLKILFGSSVAIILLINLWNLWLLLAILVVLIYGFLTFKWFFIEEKMRNSLVLALISHQPLAFLLNLYLVIFSLLQSGTSIISSNLALGDFILIALLFWMPVLAWETSRKIRGRGKETEYVTYSKLFGPRRASLLPLSFMLLSILLCAYFHYQLDFHWLHLVAVAGILVGTGWVYLRFMINPTPEKNLLKPATEIFSTLLLLNIVVHAFIKIYQA